MWSKILAAKKFEDDREVDSFWKLRPIAQDKDWQEQGIYDRLFSCGGDYIEVQWDNSIIKS